MQVSQTVFKAGDLPQFALPISCVGQKLMLKQRVEEEVEGVREVPGDFCLLHDQTMTITSFFES